MTAKIEEDFWNSSSLSAFNWEDDDFSHQLNDFDGQLTASEARDSLPLHSIISQNNLDLILDDIPSTLAYVVDPVEDTIRKALMGHKYSLEIYKRLQDKMNLLDLTLEALDGDLIFKVILFLRSTLKPNIFFEMLSKRKLAFKHYCHYLIIYNHFQELSDLYMATGHNMNMKHIFYLLGKDSVNKIVLFKKWKQFSIEHLQNIDEKNEIHDNLLFLEWQNEKNQTANNVIEALSLLCQSEWKKNKSSKDAILEFKKLMKIDEMSFEWTIMNVLVCMQHWQQLTDWFVKPNWFNKKNVLKTTIPQDIFVYGISRHKPPKNILENCLSYMTDIEKSVNLAQKLHCHKFVIQHYISQKDRLSLLAYQMRVASHEEEHLMIDNALQYEKKWKN